ncbi:4Fe-4S binding protein [Desulfovirgula thermocuniculi]|uniref:4Fe-4S binding protein n=1 Tax=Desulfovirgula thermocuniculi TaxID=348842 RepID=UPI000A06011A|nr:4Fe-4S binding protein [Desulfovirgula thermocuniculi]
MAEPQKQQKEVVINLGGVQITVPPGTKVKEAAAAAGVEIPPLKVDPEKCKGCQSCTKVCETGAIAGNKKEPHAIDPAKCIRCGECLAKCKLGAIVPAA